tara:strand:- start:661 stop:1785 length:1125 start_codon:yes stop_codon:yes gene_type:complete
MAVRLKKKIRLFDLYKKNKVYKKEFFNKLNSIIVNSEFIGGSYVNKFEKSFARLNKVKYCQSCGNGTDAIFGSLKALNIGTGDEVLLSSHDWISASEAVVACGAKPIFIDVKKGSFLIDDNKIERKISKKTKAIIIVHIYGQVFNFDKLLKLKKKYKFKIIEDCAQSHLGKYNNKFVGTIGDVGCFSFFPTKNLGAFGDAGAVITNNLSIYKKVKMIFNHGGLKKNQHIINGINSRLDNIQALILLLKLKNLKKEIQIRKKKAIIFNNLFSKIKEVKLLNNKEYKDHVYHLYVILVPKRDELLKYLNKTGIEASIHYPTPMPFVEANNLFLKSKNKFKNINYISKKIISIPFHPNISDFKMKKIVLAIQKFYKK